METPAGDSIPLIDIPQWHFEWQFYYRFLSPVHVPAGTVFKTEGVYDNTVWNPLNPHDPPVEVTYGSLTTDEMFLVYLIWSDYQEGDEDLVLGTVEEEEVSEVVHIEVPSGRLAVAPNPASVSAALTWSGDDVVQAVVRSMGGGVVWTGTLVPGVQELPVSGFAPGAYVVTVQGDRAERESLPLWVAR
jgi:hypothetical protein